MPAEAVDRLVGVSAEDGAERYPKVNIFNGSAWRVLNRLSVVPPTKMSAARAVQGFFMAAGGSWDAWIPQDDRQRKHRIQAAKLTARASGGSDSSRSGRGIQRLWSPTLPSIS